tara:strand:- start:144 stop:653 length:510 start_codon:yes stop_codon:yes gene_type:complete
MPITFHPNGTITGAALTFDVGSGAPGSTVQHIVVPPQNVNNRSSQNAESWSGTSITASITPTSATNRIVIDSAFCCYSDNDAGGGYLSWNNQAGGTSLELQKTVIYPKRNWITQPCRFQQIAGTTSTMTFELKIKIYNTGTYYTGWESSQGSSATNQNGAYCHIMEIKV